MKCVICHSPDIEEREVEETVWLEEDAILLPIRVLVCLNCGERYYDRRTMQRLEQLEWQARNNRDALRPVGVVRRLSASTS